GVTSRARANRSPDPAVRVQVSPSTEVTRTILADPTSRPFAPPHVGSHSSGQSAMTVLLIAKPLDVDGGKILGG
ncbi:MAG TPA: hypothetical protein VLK34_10670, partial [Nocardioidaceae bacterium]|nr:hypothetical protein [Nocardioidaceae bacterium]